MFKNDPFLKCAREKLGLNEQDVYRYLYDYEINSIYQLYAWRVKVGEPNSFIVYPEFKDFVFCHKCSINGINLPMEPKYYQKNKYFGFEYRKSLGIGDTFYNCKNCGKLCFIQENFPKDLLINYKKNDFWIKKNLTREDKIKICYLLNNDEFIRCFPKIVEEIVDYINLYCETKSVNNFVL